MFYTMINILNISSKIELYSCKDLTSPQHLAVERNMNLLRTVHLGETVIKIQFATEIKKKM